MSELSRRDFLSRTAGTVAGLAASTTLRAGALVSSQPGGAADLVIVGAGLAGMAAAITAADAGARVALIDKRYKVGGTAMGAGGSFSAAGSALQQAKHIDDSPERHFQDANRIGRGKADPAILRLYTEQAAPTQAWLEQLGVTFDPKGPRMAPEHELYSVPRTCDAIGGGPGYIAALSRQLNARVTAGKIVLRTETAARRLLTESKRVVGVEVADDDGTVSAVRGKAVLLACGGYGSNRAMVAHYNPSLANALTVASKYATGDGLRMAEEVGAHLANMDLLVPYFAGVENPPGSGRTMMLSLVTAVLTSMKGDVWVTKRSRRFVNEDSHSPDERERALRTIPDATLFVLFDDAMLKSSAKPPLVNFDQHLQDGHVVKRAGSIGELAALAGLAPAALEKTIEDYNGYVSAGRDPEFGRTNLVPFDHPPFYAILASGVVFMTAGGVRTNTSLQALDANGTPIAGLYAAGEVQGAGQWMGDGLVGGAGNGGALVFGRLAARAAVGA